MFFDLIGIGTQLGIDLLETKDGLIEKYGGSVANTLVALRHLGLKTGYIGLVSSDQKGIQALQELKNTVIDVQRVRIVDNPTPVCKIKVTKNNRILTQLGTRKTLTDFTPEDMGYLKTSKSVFLRFNASLTERYVEFSKNNGAKVFLSLHNLDTDKDLQILENLPIDIIFANKEEAKALNSVKRLVENGTEVVITHDRKGSIVYTIRGDKMTFSGFKVNALDPTGAGDAFAAGYIYGYLNGWDLEKRAEFANAMGGIATLQYGARLKVSVEQVLEFIEKNKY